MVMEYSSSFKVCEDNNSKKDRHCRVNLHVEGDSTSIDYIKHTVPALSKAVSDLAVDCEITQVYK